MRVKCFAYLVNLCQFMNVPPCVLHRYDIRRLCLLAGACLLANVLTAAEPPKHATETVEMQSTVFGDNHEVSARRQLSFADSRHSEAPCVILLHGLARSSSSMNALQETLQGVGFNTVNVDYPSRKHRIPVLAEMAVGFAVEQCAELGTGPVHAVTHSMGGILFRQYAKQHPDALFSSVVMLGPPNQGSEVIDRLRGVPGFAFMNGPAGLQLGTDANSVPILLGAVSHDVAVIAGTASINMILSQFLPNPDDGKVSVARTRIEGMCAFITVDVSHPFLMKNKQVQAEVVSYLTTRKFASSGAEYPTTCAVQNGI